MYLRLFILPELLYGGLVFVINSYAVCIWSILQKTDLVADKFANSGLSDSRVERIGLFLAAHFASANSPVMQSERTGPHQWTRQGETGMGLDSTYYGQMAKTLDTTGVLGNLGMRIATIGVIGKPEE